MKNVFVVIKLCLELVRCFPHLILFFFHRNKIVIQADTTRWAEICGIKYNKPLNFLYLLSFNPEFRNLFYKRIGLVGNILNIFCPKMSTLFIATDNIGEGLFIQHGFATYIAAESIGKNCWINQQVTIGFSTSMVRPTLMDNVTISAGAKVIGNVTIGNNSIVGANAVVVKDVPDNCVVVGVPAFIVKRNGIKVYERL